MARRKKRKGKGTSSRKIREKNNFVCRDERGGKKREKGRLSQELEDQGLVINNFRGKKGKEKSMGEFEEGEGGNSRITGSVSRWERGREKRGQDRYFLDSVARTI